jgi:uncharacterized protein YpmB
MKRKLFSILIAVMAIYLVGTTYVYANSQQLVASAEAEAKQEAKEAGLTNISNFYVFNKDETYYALMGENSEGRQVYFAYQPESDYQKMAKQLERQNLAYNKFCDDNDLKRLADRIQVAQWTREDARKSIAAARAAST